MIEKVLLLTGSSVVLILGSLHLYYTFFSHKLHPRNSAVEDAMKNTSPRLTKDTTLWSAWIGFNASHSLGAIFFGAFNLALASTQFSVLKESISLQIINIIALLFYLFLAKKYWFKIPFIGILLSTICFIIAFILLDIEINT